MSYRDILVHLDGGARDDARIAIAASFVRRFGGRLTGLFARSEHYGPSLVAHRASEALIAAGQIAEHRFACATSGLPARFWRLAYGEPAHILAETAACCRLSDLVVLGQHHASKDAPAELVERMILEAGRPVLIIPSVGEYPTVGEAVMIAWNGSREATRALHDAMPILKTATGVEVVTVRPSGGKTGPDGAVPPLSVLDHLATHGVKVTKEVLAAEDIGIMDLLLSRAFDQGADLLIMGAHGGTQIPFFKGAGTRHILDHMTLPVLMAC